MATDDLIKKHQTKLETMRDEVRGRKQEVLDNIDLDALMKNPKVYFTKLSQEFYRSNADKIEKSINMGKDLAQAILKDVGNDKS